MCDGSNKRGLTKPWGRLKQDMTSGKERIEELVGDDALVNESRLNSISERESPLSQGVDLFLRGLVHW